MFLKANSSEADFLAEHSRYRLYVEVLPRPAGRTFEVVHATIQQCFQQSTSSRICQNSSPRVKTRQIPFKMKTSSNLHTRTHTVREDFVTEAVDGNSAGFCSSKIAPLAV